MTAETEDRAIELADQLGKFIAANVVPERQAKVEAACIARLYAAQDKERDRLAGIYGEMT